MHELYFPYVSQGSVVSAYDLPDKGRKLSVGNERAAQVISSRETSQARCRILVL
jgi:hypothetical protein